MLCSCVGGWGTGVGGGEILSTSMIKNTFKLNYVEYTTRFSLLLGVMIL